MHSRSSSCCRWPAPVLLALAACATTQAPHAVTPLPASPQAEVVPTPALPVREDLPAEVQEVLEARMIRHGEQMSAMMLAVVLLDYEVVRLLAARMIREPVLGRPSKSDTSSLNAMLPLSFFVHQDALVASTRGLAAAAELKDDQNLVTAFNEVSRTCVGCHSAYLHDALVEEPDFGPPCELPGVCEGEIDPSAAYVRPGRASRAESAAAGGAGH